MAVVPIQVEELDVKRELEAAEKRELVRFVVVGSVDDGKSTLIGRLLYESNALYEDQVAQVRKASKQGGDEIDFSLFTDGLKAEREQAITIDVAYRYFSTAKRKFIIADTPGHTQYTRNMATGASTADVAIILVDARMGLQTQSKRHAYIARLLGIKRLAVAINKMDLVNFDQERFNQIKSDLLFFARRLEFERIDFFPISARGGDNVVAPSPRTKWHEGGTILQYLETVPVQRDISGEQWRFPVQYVLRPHLDYRGFAGQIASGSVAVGDEVVVLPSGVRTRIKAIDTFEGSIDRAFAPMSVTVRLKDEVDVSRGDMLAHPAAPPTVTTQLVTMVVWLNEKPLRKDSPYLLRHTTRTVPVKVQSLEWRLDLESLDQTRASELSLNDIARLKLSCNRPLVADPYTENRGTGSFILIDPLTNATVAAGMIVSTEAEARQQVTDIKPITAEERAARFGHKAAIVLVSGKDDAASVNAAAALERALFDAGLHIAAAHSAPENAVACAEAGLIAVQPAVGDADARARTAAVLRVSGIQVIDGAGTDDLDALVSKVRRAIALETKSARTTTA